MLSRLDSALDESWERRLHSEIEALYLEVVAVSGELPDLAERSLLQLQEARQILVETPEAYGVAEYRVAHVRAMLERQRESARQARHYGPRVLGYEALWLTLLIAGLLAGPAVVRLAGDALVGNGVGMDGFLPLWTMMMWGGIGGAFGAVYHLTRHAGGRGDFDRRFLVAYLVRPLIGMVIGGGLGLVVRVGLAAADPSSVDSAVAAVGDALAKLLVVLLGFWQGRLYRLFGRRSGAEDVAQVQRRRLGPLGV